MNGTGNSSSFVPDLSRLVTLTVVLTLCLFSVCLNSLLIYCFVAKRNQTWAKKAKQVFYLILSDLLVSLLLILRLIFEIASVGRKTYEFCAVFNFTANFTQLVSYYHVLALCIHRYTVVRKAHLPVQSDRTRYGIQSLIIWVTVFLASVPPYVFWGQYGEVLVDCRLWYILRSTDRGAVIYILASFCVPWIITNVVYMAMVFRFRCLGRVRPSQSIRLASFRSAGTAVEPFNPINQVIPSANTVATNQLAAATSISQTAEKQSAATKSTNQFAEKQPPHQHLPTNSLKNSRPQQHLPTLSLKTN